MAVNPGDAQGIAIGIAIVVQYVDTDAAIFIEVELIVLRIGGVVHRLVGRDVAVLLGSAEVIVLCLGRQVQAFGLEPHRRIQLPARFIQQHEAVAATRCATGAAGRTRARRGGLELRGRVEAGGDGLFQLRGRLVRRGFGGFAGGGLPGAVRTYVEQLAVGQLQGCRTARLGQ